MCLQTIKNPPPRLLNTAHVSAKLDTVRPTLIVPIIARFLATEVTGDFPKWALPCPAATTQCFWALKSSYCTRLDRFRLQNGHPQTMCLPCICVRWGPKHQFFPLDSFFKSAYSWCPTRHSDGFGSCAWCQRASEHQGRCTSLVSWWQLLAAKKASDKKGTGFLHYVMESDVCTSYTISAVLYYHII